jgi:hypothetical protein
MVTSCDKLDNAVIRYTTHEKSRGRIANVIFSINAPFSDVSAIKTPD